MANNNVKMFACYAAGFLAIALSTISAHADANLNCQAYAQAAISHQNQNLQKKCGFTGGRWSLNHAGHLAWCKSANVKMVNLTTEDKARAKALNSCKKKKDGKLANRQKDLKCQVYASKSVKLISRRNKACNKTSTNDSILDFRRYCMKVGPAFANKKYAAMQAELKSCKNVPGCRNYAKNAVIRAKQNTSYNCRYTSPLYAIDYAAHYRWCLKAGLGEASKAGAVAKSSIAKCKVTKVKTIKPRIGYTSFTLKKRTMLGYMVCSHPKGNSNRKCGLSVASKVCRVKGYRNALWYKTLLITNPSHMVSAYYIGTKSACKGVCRDFEKITCVRK